MKRRVEKDFPELNFLLRAKLTPPRGIQQSIRRERLLRKLSDNKSNLAVIVAEAGYGKTTLAADFVLNSGSSFVWYQLDYTDSDISTFFAYLTYGINQSIPRFGHRLFDYIHRQSEELIQFPERVADLFLNEAFELIDKPLLVVLDDYHHLEKNSSVHKIISRILRYAPELLSFLITTRDLPPLQSIRSDLSSSMLLVTMEDLAFDEQEIRTLFKHTLQIDLSNEDAYRCYEITEGWVTALQLVLQIAQQERTLKFDLENLLQKSKIDLFRYFAEEVFSRESPQMQQLLLHLSLLKGDYLRFCQQIFPETCCLDLLSDLRGRNIFISLLDDDKEEYRIHPLFRDFLQYKLRRDIGIDAFKKKLNKIGEFFESQGDFEQAVDYFLQAENFHKAAQILQKQGSIWLEKGKIILLERFVSQIPEEKLSDHPEILLHKAEINRLHGKTDEALNILQKASRIFEEKGDIRGKAEALHLMASVIRRQGRIETALQVLSDVERLIDADRETNAFASVRLKMANTKGLCYIKQGKWDEAEECFKLTLKLAEELLNEKYTKIALHNMALPAAFRGDFTEALRWFGKIFTDSKSMPQEAIGHLNVARLHIFRGELNDAEKHLKQAIEICQAFNLKDLMAEVLEAFGNLHREKGEYQKAADFYAQAEKLYIELGIDLSAQNLLEERAKLYLLLGWDSKAKGLAERLLESRNKRGSQLSIKTARFLLAYIRAAMHDLKDLEDEVCELKEFFREKELNYDEAQAALLLARIYLATGKRQAAFEALERALDLTARFDYDYWLSSEIKINSDFFNDPDVKAMLPDLQIVSDTLPVITKSTIKNLNVNAKVFDLVLHTFGKIEIRRASTLIPQSAWITRRARDIFIFIATSKNRRALKDNIIETFWMDEDPSIVEKNFHPTISHIRKALNWHQPLKVNVITFSDGAYQINPELSCFIDTEEFELALAEAHKARISEDIEKMKINLIRAMELYAGEFMPGVYDDWVEEKRRYFDSQYLRVLGSLAKMSFSQKDFASVITYTEKLLQKDPFREDAYRLLMQTYAAQGKRAEVVRCFDELQNVLKKELNVQPSSKTVKLFHELLERA